MVPFETGGWVNCFVRDTLGGARCSCAGVKNLSLNHYQFEMCQKGYCINVEKSMVLSLKIFLRYSRCK